MKLIESFFWIILSIITLTTTSSTWKLHDLIFYCSPPKTLTLLTYKVLDGPFQIFDQTSRKIFGFFVPKSQEWDKPKINTCQYLRHVPDVVEQVKEELWWECLFAHGRNMLDACHQLLTMCVDIFGDHLLHVEVVVNGFDPRRSLQIIRLSVVLFQDRLLGCIGSAVSIQA